MTLDDARTAPRVIAVLVSVAFCAALAVAPAAADHRASTVALRGEDPVEAAIAWSAQRFPETAGSALLATSGDFADALSSGVAQGVLDAPLLLTAGEALDPRTRAELERLEVMEVHVLGGPAAVSEEVVAELTEMGVTATRHSGATRIETAVAIATAVVEDGRVAVLARAFGDEGGDPTRAWADSLAAGALAAQTGRPLLLTATDELPASVAAYLEEAGITGMTVVGGTAAVSDAVIAQIEALGISAERVSGPTRAATAVALAARRGFADAAAADAVVLLEGQADGAWAPGFAAAGPAMAAGAPVLLAIGETLPPETEEFLATAAGAETAPQLLCGPGVARRACDLAAAALGYDAAHANATASGAPELVRVEMRSITDGVMHVRYWFDEEVTLGTGGASPFRLAAPDTTMLVSASGAAVAEDDARAVDVTVPAEHAALHATLALADAGAVEDAAGVASPDGSAELSDVAALPGRTTRPDLVSASAEDGAVTLAFDAPVEQAMGGNVVAVLADGRTVTGGNATLADGGRTVRVAMSGVTAAEVRRVATRPGAVFTQAGSNPLAVVAVAEGGRTDGPDLVGVVPSATADEVRFVFDADLVPLAEGGAATAFRLRYENGTETTSADTTTLADPRTVVARFPEGAVNRLVVAAAAGEGAVESADGVPSADDARGIARTFAFGESLGPRLVEAEVREIEEEGVTAAVAGQAEVRLVFDRAVSQVTSVRIAALDRDGARVALSGCSLEPGITQDTVVCEVPPGPVGEEARLLVAATVAYDAVRASGSQRMGTEPASGFGRTVAMPGTPATVPFAAPA